MPVYKDEKRGTWYCCFYYTDWQGHRQRKLKRGFPKQRDAKEFERDFMDKLQGTPQMTFKSLVELYVADMKNRLRKSTMENKEHMIRTKLLPYWGNLALSKITPANIRKWQNELIAQQYSETYLKAINNQLCAILNPHPVGVVDFVVMLCVGTQISGDPTGILMSLCYALLGSTTSAILCVTEPREPATLP